MIGKRMGTGWIAVVLAGSAWAQVTRVVSGAASGAPGDGDCADTSLPHLTPDGRYLFFVSLASNLVAGDTNGKQDLFLRDLQTGVIERLNVASGGAESNGANFTDIEGRISSDARFAAYDSDATNLVPGDTNGTWDVFRRDRQTGTTTRVSVDSSGIQGNSFSFFPAISDDGRFVAFESYATNLVPGDTSFVDIFVRDVQMGTTEKVSVDSSGVPGNGYSVRCAMSADGRFVAFSSYANNLVPGDTNGSSDIFLRDRLLGTTERIDLDSSGNQGGAGSSQFASLSADGRYVGFYSEKSNLIPGDTNGAGDSFVRDRLLGTTERVSVSAGGTEGNWSSSAPTVSWDGRYVAFRSTATNLVPGDTNGLDDVFLRDRQAGTIEIVSLTYWGSQGNADSKGPSISADGRYVTFHSTATNFVPGDTNGKQDVFLRDRSGGPDVTYACEPGTGGVVGCPCSNAPSGSGRGCDNSSGTGGATLSATGATSLSSDSLVFTTSGERPTALSVVFQGTTSIPAGLVYGQGVRCAGGALKRLYSKNASGGSITAPNYGAGELTVSARSAAKGDVIAPGGIRYYFVTYRDPAVLGGCPSTSTFNVTTSARASWSP